LIIRLAFAELVLGILESEYFRFGLNIFGSDFFNEKDVAGNMVGMKSD
jgi:hypothetical protein